MKRKIRILIADDHAVVRRGLRSLFQTERDFQVVGEAANGVETINLAKRLCPDVIVMDLIMPEKAERRRRRRSCPNFQKHASSCLRPSARQTTWQRR